MVSLPRRSPRPALIALIVLVTALLVGGVVLDWVNKNRGPQDPATVEVVFSVEGKEVRALPYSLCATDNACTVTDTVEIPRSTEPVTISVPADVADHDWQVIAIYDDPAANEQRYVTDYVTSSIEVASVKDDAQLVVLEVSSLMLSADEEEVYATVWAANVEGADGAADPESTDSSETPSN